MPPVHAAQGIPGDEGRVAPSRWKVRRASKVQGAAGNVDLWQSDRLRDSVADAEIGRVEGAAAKRATATDDDKGAPRGRRTARNATA